MGLGVEKVGGQVSYGSKVGGGHRALAHACEGAAAGHAAVRVPCWRLPMALLPVPLPLPLPLWPEQPQSIKICRDAKQTEPFKYMICQRTGDRKCCLVVHVDCPSDAVWCER